MNTSPTLAALAKALAAAQREMGVAHKDAINPHYRSKYADLQAIDEACRPILSKHGIAIIQGAGYLEGFASVTTRLLHQEGEWIEDTLQIPVSKVDAQGVSSAITYGRRIGLSALVAIPAGIDDDGESAVGRGDLRGVTSTPPPTVDPPNPPPAGGDLPNIEPKPYPMAFSLGEMRAVFRIHTGDTPSAPTKVYWTDAVGRLSKFSESTGQKVPTVATLGDAWGEARFSTFRRWTCPVGAGSMVRLRGVTRTTKGDKTYWNFESAEAYPQGADMGGADDLPF